MSLDEEDQTFEVEDSEGFVDKQLKKALLKKREKIDDVEEEWFTAAELGEIDYDTAVRRWHTAIKKWLRRFEPLLQDDTLENAQYVYREHNFGSVRLDPPQDLLEAQGRPSDPRGLGGMRIEGDVEPVTTQIIGLVSIIQGEQLTASWTVTVANDDPRQGGRQTIERTVTTPYPKWVLEEAIRVGDSWLQNAGVGMAMSSGEPHGMT